MGGNTDYNKASIQLQFSLQIQSSLQIQCITSQSLNKVFLDGTLYNDPLISMKE